MESFKEDKFEIFSIWKTRGMRSRLALIVAVSWSVYTISYLCNLFFYLDVVVYPITHRAISTGLICMLAFLLSTPKGKAPREKLKWVDVLPILFIGLGCTYIALNANRLVAEGRLIPYPFEMILASITFFLVIEAIRRTIGLTVAILIVVFFFTAVYSNYFPGIFHSTGFSYPMILGWMYLGAEGLWGMVLGVVSTIVAGFIIFGGFLRALGASQFFIDLALSATGFMRGGPAKAAVIASSLFGTISGSIAANVATTGQITIPLMKSIGYKKDYAGAVEAVASTGGMFVPPVMGATAFLIAEFLNISYWSVCVAAFLPAIVYYATLFTQIHIEAVKMGLKGLPRENLPSLRKTLIEGWHYLLPLILLIFLLGILRYSEQTSIMYTIGGLILVSFFRKKSRLDFRKFLIAMEDSARGMIPIIPLCTGIGVLIGAIEITGIGINLTSKLLALSGGNLMVLLIMTALVAFILGMGMTAVSVYLLTVTLIAPAVIKAGVEPIAAHMFLFYFGCLSFITPPVAVGAYIGAGIAGGDPWKTGFQAMRLGFVAFLVPWAFVLEPGILMIGHPLKVIASFIFITLGAMSIGVAFEMYFFKELKIWENILLILIGICLFTPDYIIRGVALVFLGIFIFIHLIKTRFEKYFFIL